MITNPEVISDPVSRLIANIEEDCAEELAEIDAVLVIAAVHYGSTEDGSGDIGSTFYTCSSGRGFIQRGLLEDARRAVDVNTTPRED